MPPAAVWGVAGGDARSGCLLHGKETPLNRSRPWLTWLLFVCAIAAPLRAAASSSARWYVAMSGSDLNPGTRAKPFRTLQHAADMARPGDVIDVRGGTYCQRLAITRSGDAKGGYITFRSEPGETAVLDGGCFLLHGGAAAMISLHDVSYIRIEGLEVRNLKTADPASVPFGIRVYGHGSHIELLDNNVHNIEQMYQGRRVVGSGANGFGIAVYGTDAASPITGLVIDGNKVHDLQTGSSESLVLNGNVTHFRVSHNEVYENNNIGIDVIGFERTAPDPAVDRARDGVVEENRVYDISSRGNPAYGSEASSDGIYVDGGMHVVIQNNIVHDTDFGIEMASEHFGRDTSYILARNNLIYSCHTAGVSIGGYGLRRGGSDHITIVNNTLYRNNAWHTGTGEFYMQYHMQNNVFENNIVYAGSAGRMMKSRSGRMEPGIPTVEMDHNVYYYAGGPDAAKWSYDGKAYSSFEDYVKSTGNDRHSVFANPEFGDPEADDFQLRAGSPAIGHGARLGKK
jgi:hypothetical protein